MHYDPMDSENIHLYLHNSQANGEAARPRQHYRKNYNVDNTATRYSPDLPVQPGYNFRSRPNLEQGSQNQRNSPYNQLPYQQTYPQSAYPQNMYPPSSFPPSSYPQATYPYNTYPQSMYRQRSYPKSTYKPDYSQINQYRAHHAAQPYAAPYASPNALAPSPSAYAPSSCGSKLLFGCSPQVQQIPCTTAGQYQPIQPYDPYQQYRMAADRDVKPVIPEFKPSAVASVEPAPENANQSTTNGQTDPKQANGKITQTTELNDDKNAKTNNNNNNHKPDFDLSRFGVPGGRAATPEFPTPPPSVPCTNSASNQGIQFPSAIPRIPAYSPSYLVPTPPPAAPRSPDANSTDSNANVAKSLNDDASETSTPKSDESDKLPTTPEHIVGSTHMGSHYNPADRLITTPSHLLQHYPNQPARPTYGASNYFQNPGVITTPNHLRPQEPYPIYRPHTPNYNVSPNNHPGAWN